MNRLNWQRLVSWGAKQRSKDCRCPHGLLKELTKTVLDVCRGSCVRHRSHRHLLARMTTITVRKIQFGPVIGRGQRSSLPTIVLESPGSVLAARNAYRLLRGTVYFDGHCIGQGSDSPTRCELTYT